MGFFPIQCFWGKIWPISYSCYGLLFGQIDFRNIIGRGFHRGLQKKILKKTQSLTHLWPKARSPSFSEWTVGPLTVSLYDVVFRSPVWWGGGGGGVHLCQIVVGSVGIRLDFLKVQCCTCHLCCFQFPSYHYVFLCFHSIHACSLMDYIWLG